MLVLSREIGESIIIGDSEIIVTVVDVRAMGKVRLGVTAPPSLPVHREEIYEAIRRDGRRFKMNGESELPPDKLYTVAHALSSHYVECLERNAAALGVHPDVLIVKFVRDGLEKMMAEEAQEREFTGEGR